MRSDKQFTETCEDKLMEQILESINTTPIGHVLKMIASLPQIREQKILDIREQLTSQSGNRYLRKERDFNPTSRIDNYILLENLQLGSSQGSYTVPLADIDIELKQRFDKLAKKWKRETIHFSLIQQMVLHPAYQEIIGLGPKVISLILNELKKEPDFWFWALRALTGEDPTTEEMQGDLQAMTKAWLSWGYDHAYLLKEMRGDLQAMTKV